ncbi:hypothetical protein DXN05_13245 [Deminuibacter soli]|uniref:Uncharacterized protein n=2 Tax=Deminuibacter soli TaxID=2291815 RepID=A0A3E1NIB4_9BACT|nr:hypothetical protein DXN05_13245 [Deminuibacter soli]
MLFGVAMSLHAQKEAVFCKGKGYRGYVFDTSYLVLKSIKEQHSRAVLSCDEIKVAEGILKNNLASLNANKVNQTDGCPNISKKLCKYRRQYFGFINSKGEKVVWINMFWNKEFNDSSKHQLVSVSDGCSYYWNIEVNITTNTLSNLQINGKG